jgi:medium-chain acyl-[acyl-carrier-protein] hydrolase
MAGGAANAWFRAVRRGQPATRLYCFPYAGGSVTAFLPLGREIRSHAEVLVASLPGRGPRLSEPPETDLGRLVAPLADGIARAGAHDFVLFGHSMGALLCFEVARELRRRGGPTPAGLLVSGARAPQFFGSPEEERVHHLPQREFIAHLRSLQGTPAEVLASPEIMDLLLPALRADFRICETYRYLPGPPLSSPVVVLFGRDDKDVRPQHAAGWRSHTSGPCVVRALSGGHFFLDPHWPEIGSILDALLERGAPVAAPELAAAQ